MVLMVFRCSLLLFFVVELVMCSLFLILFFVLCSLSLLSLFCVFVFVSSIRMSHSFGIALCFESGSLSFVLVLFVLALCFCFCFRIVLVVYGLLFVFRSLV